MKNTTLKFAKDTEGDWVALPLAMLMQTIFFGGYKGSGKTTAMKKLFEAAYAAGAQCVSIAPLGKWYSLRIAKNGKGRGLKLVVFGGEFGDVPVLPGSGRVIARAVHEKKLHAVLDVELMRKDDRAVFLADFFEELMMLRKRGRHGAMVVFLDETQSVAPQLSTSKEVARLRGLLGDFARECRNFSCGLVMSAQRSASVDKELIALCDMLIVMRTVHNLDRKAYEKWVDEKGSGDEDAGSWLRKLRRLKKGEAYLYAPEENLFQRVTVEMIKTYDATATATIGERVARIGALGKLNVKRLSAELSELVKVAAGEDPNTLKAKIKELEMKLAAKAITQVVTGAIVGAAAATKPAKKVGRSEKVIRRNLERYLKRLNKHTAAFEKILSVLDKERDRMAQAQQVVVSELSNTRKALGLAVVLKPGESTGYGIQNSKLSTTAVRIKLGSDVVRVGAPTPAGEKRVRSPVASGTPDVDIVAAARAKGPRAILIALSQCPNGATREQLTVMTGYKRSTRDAYLQRLIAVMWAADSGGTLIHATDVGIAELGSDYQPLPTGAALREHWLGRLPSGESKIFKLLVESYPQTIVRERISELSGFKTSTRNAYLQRLFSRQLVTDGPSGDPLASPTLFHGDNT